MSLSCLRRTSEPSNSHEYEGLSKEMFQRFFDYLPRYYNLYLMVAVEVSAKSKTCNESSTNLNHCLQVMKVIECFFKAMDPYISERRFHSLAFNGNMSIKGQTSACFNLSREENRSELSRVEEIIKYYKSVVNNDLAGEPVDPAALSEVIKKAVDFVEVSCRHNSRKYFLSLIIMDEVWVDVEGTLDNLVRASKFPISFIIAGDSTNLKAVEALLTRDVAPRDRVHCVPKSRLCADEGVAEILSEEIPKQFYDVLRRKGLEQTMRELMNQSSQ